MCEEVGSERFFNSVLSMNVIFRAVGRLAPPARGWAGTLLRVLCLQQQRSGVGMFGLELFGWKGQSMFV